MLSTILGPMHKCSMAFEQKHTRRVNRYDLSERVAYQREPLHVEFSDMTSAAWRSRSEFPLCRRLSCRSFNYA